MATSKHQIRNREQADKVLDLRRAGLSYREIEAALRRLNPPITISWVRCHQIVKALLKEKDAELKEKTEHLRSLELERVDALQAKLWPKRDNPRVVDTLLRVMDRRAKLLGLDAPISANIGGASLVGVVVLPALGAPNASPDALSALGHREIASALPSASAGRLGAPEAIPAADYEILAEEPGP